MAQSVKNPPAMQETWVLCLGGKDPLEEGMATTPVFLPGESPWILPRGDWRPRVPGVSKSRTRLSDQTQHSYCGVWQSLRSSPLRAPRSAGRRSPRLTEDTENPASKVREPKKPRDRKNQKPPLILFHTEACNHRLQGKEGLIFLLESQW